MKKKKKKVKMTKPKYLELSILSISKTIMYEFWYDYIKPKYGDNTQLCYLDIDSIVIYIKTEDFYKNIEFLFQLVNAKKYPTWNDKFELPDCLYSLSDIQDHFEYTPRKC